MVIKSLNPLRDIQEEKPIASCGMYGCEIFKDETLYFWEGKWICYDCFKSAVTALLEDNPQQLALEMQIDMQRYV